MKSSHLQTMQSSAGSGTPNGSRRQPCGAVVRPGASPAQQQPNPFSNAKHSRTPVGQHSGIHTSACQRALEMARFGLAATVLATALGCQPAAAMTQGWQQQQQQQQQQQLQPPSLVLLDIGSSGNGNAFGGGNSAILGELKRLQQTKQRYGTKEPGAALSDRFLAAEDQLQRIQLLVQLKQYDNARMQLREGAFKNLRGDLRYEELYRGVAAQAVQDVVQGVEQLDGQLKRREGLEAIKPALQQLQKQLQQVISEGQQ